jgi:hypothetical protein
MIHSIPQIHAWVLWPNFTPSTSNIQVMDLSPIMLSVSSVLSTSSYSKKELRRKRPSKLQPFLLRLLEE